MKTKLFAILVCICIAAGAGFAQGKPGNQDGQPTPPQNQTEVQKSGSQTAQPQQNELQVKIQELAREVKQLNLTQDEAKQIQEALEKQTQTMELARAEIREMQAKLSRLLLEEKPNRSEIEKTIRQSIEAEYRIRMMQMERILAVREILGQNRWTILVRIMKQMEGKELTKEEIKELVKLGINAETLRLLFGIIKSLQ